MQLTDDEQVIFDGGIGEARQLAIRLLMSLGELYGASKLVDIDSVQLRCPVSEAGISAWIEMLKYYAGRRLVTTVPTFTGARAATSSKLQKQLEIFHEKISITEPEKIFILRNKIDEYYERLGIKAQRIYPSSAGAKVLSNCKNSAAADPGTAVFLNSVFGIRTNIESPAAALASAIIGKTTLSGMHLVENRLPDIQVRINTELSEGDLTLIGLYVGERNKKNIPYFKPDGDTVAFDKRELFELSTALAMAGNIPMFHINSVTPEHGLYRSTAIKRKIRVNSNDLKKLRKQWRPESVPDLVVIGAPYASHEELQKAAKILKNKHVAKDLQMWFFTTREIYNDLRSDRICSTIEKAGAKIFSDCNFTDIPPGILSDCEIVTDSAKTLEWVTTHNNRSLKISLLPTSDCLDLGFSGRLDA